MCDYFARFHLSIGLNVSILFHAPTLLNSDFRVQPKSSVEEGFGEYFGDRASPISSDNVGSAVVEIVKDSFSLGISMVVDNEEEEWEEEEEEADQVDGHVAKMQLIRLVNGVPLHDCADAKACALVLQLPFLKCWRTYGLNVTASPPTTNLVPTFDVKDVVSLGLDAKSQSQLNTLPAGLRLKKIICVVNVRAKTDEVAFPTLSKSRLPQGDSRMDNALEVGVKACLAQLAGAGGGLLSEPKDLRREIRLKVDVPAISEAMGSVIAGMRSKKRRERACDGLGLGLGLSGGSGSGRGSGGGGCSSKEDIAQALSVRLKAVIEK